jgi:hypothetical protein
MRQMIILLIFGVSVAVVNAQNTPKGDNHASQTVVIKIEGSQNGWVKGDNDATSVSSNAVTTIENVSFNGTSDGIYVTINNGTNKIKLFALTGLLLLDGEVSQGRFFIPTRKGIYFLKINNKSCKVICK